MLETKRDMTDKYRETTSRTARGWRSRALMSRPKPMLFDEPSLGFAPTLVERTFEIVAEIRRRETTVPMVERSALAALGMCDRSYFLATGRIARHGSGREMLANPHIRKAYLGG